MFHPQINDWIMPYWSEKINLIYSAYKDLPLPFTDNKRYRSDAFMSPEQSIEGNKLGAVSLQFLWFPYYILFLSP